MPAGKPHEPDTVLDHEYDGIREYDNRLPNWWLWILWGSIVFAVGYWLIFHTYGLAKLPLARYEQSMEEAGGSLADSSLRGLTTEDLDAMAADPAKVAEGLGVWTKNCTVCHLPEGQGLVGPNLTDDYWIHGGEALEIHHTVVHGVVEKGMAAWGRQLGSDRVDAVVAYVLTLRGRHVEGKAPEGELWSPESSVPLESGEALASEDGTAPEPQN